MMWFLIIAAQEDAWLHRLHLKIGEQLISSGKVEVTLTVGGESPTKNYLPLFTEFRDKN